MPTHVHERRVKLGGAASRLEATLGREPTREELAEATGLSLRHVDEALDIAEAPVSLNRAIGSEEDGELATCSPTSRRSTRPPRLRTRSAGSSSGGRSRSCPSASGGSSSCASASTRSRRRSRQIGKELGITRERVRQLEAQAFEHLAVELDGLAENDDEEWAA